MTDQQNMVLAIVLSIVVIVAFQYFYESPRQRQLAEQQRTQDATPPMPAPAAPAGDDFPAPPRALVGPAIEAPPSREAVLGAVPRIPVESPRLRGSVSLKGARIDDLTLIGYHVTADPGSPEITLLVPRGDPKAFFAEFGWAAAGGAEVGLPGADTVWRTDGGVLAPERPLTLFWDNGQGLKFTRTYTVDENYMFTVTRRVENRGTTTVTLFPYGFISRSGTLEAHPFGFYIHEGPVGVLDSTLEEYEYEDIRESEIDVNRGARRNIRAIKHEGVAADWIGFKEQYWLVALIPDQGRVFDVNFKYVKSDAGVDRYQAEYIERAGRVVAAGEMIEVTDRMFVGAKEIGVLEDYRDEFGIELFHMAIDYTKMFFLTIPLHKALAYFNRFLGNYGLAILLLTVIVKAMFFPLANNSYRSMNKMKLLQPKILELRELHKDDKQRIQQETMELFKAEKVSPI